MAEPYKWRTELDENFIFHKQYKSEHDMTPYFPRYAANIYVYERQNLNKYRIRSLR